MSAYICLGDKLAVPAGHASQYTQTPKMTKAPAAISSRIALPESSEGRWLGWTMPLFIAVAGVVVKQTRDMMNERLELTECQWGSST